MCGQCKNNKKNEKRKIRDNIKELTYFERVGNKNLSYNWNWTCLQNTKKYTKRNRLMRIKVLTKL